MGILAERHPDLPPPSMAVGPLRWLKENLFSTPLNTVLTVIAIAIIYKSFVPIVDWAFINANWTGSDQSACVSGGACWVFVKSRMALFIYGFYPSTEQWRIDVVFAGLAFVIGVQFVGSFPYRRWIGVFGLTGFPVVAFVLMVGGTFGLAPVATSKWGGLSLTLSLAYIGIIASLPFGVLLALGRRSEMPVVRTICVGYIELWRSVPLISVLFMASVMLPMFMPEGVSLDKLLRALTGIVLFESAYVAEVVRGGLQAIPKGQYEAAESLGLGYWKKTGLIILPQALKLVIPGIVNTVIQLFKDTTLVLIIGLFDVLGAVQVAITDPNWRRVSTEGYVFAALSYWVFCFGMSRYSMALERKLHTGHRA